MAEIDRKLYDERRKNGVCTSCGTVLRTWELSHGYTRCGKCRMSNLARSKMPQAKKDEIALRERRYAAGCCIMCGKVLIRAEDKKDGFCQECRDERYERMEWLKDEDLKRRGRTTRQAQAVAQLIETFGWLKRVVRQATADTMQAGCNGCPWLRSACLTDVNRDYCPSAAGTNPADGNCLRYTAGTGSKKPKDRKKKRKGKVK